MSHTACKYLLPCGLCEKSGEHCTLTRDKVANIEKSQDMTPGEVVKVDYDNNTIPEDPLVGMWI